MPRATTRRSAALLAIALALPGWGPVACSRRDAGTTAGAAASHNEPAIFSHAAVLPFPMNTIPVPLVRQTTSYSCGDAAALAVLRYWDSRDYGQKPESELYGPLETTTTDGTDPAPIRAYVSTVPGLRGEYVTGATVASLEAAVDHGEPAIVDIEAWQDVDSWQDLKPWGPDWDDGHYVVLVGYDAANLFFMDPSTEDHYAYIPRAQFLDRWHDVVGHDNVHTEHMVVFVHSTRTADPPPLVSRSATIID